MFVSGMDFDLNEVLRTLPGGDEGLTLVDGAELDLEGVMDSMPDQGQEGEVDPLPIPSKRRRGADLGRKSQTINETSQPLDEPRDVVPAPRPGAPSRARCEREDSLPSFGFPPTRGYHEMGVLKSLVIPARSRAIAGRSADDIERAAAVYLQRVVALQTGLAESNRRLASELKTLTEEKKKEAHHHKKKISSLRKSLEMSDARAREQETKIDNLRSVLACAPEEAVERYKASVFTFA
ncbi:uncharacterized protein LOC111366908 [Olea europaea var. sylvestris]|uniref:uncharacterized protein LOC111366908 n=1 Tax=Olea europaea var. sylvestris TaxID=158386 RepID=UPI000C1D385E|nr:uncharacterized protein LOC111366908 [Olea europaea var. sylvestris]